MPIERGKDGGKDSSFMQYMSVHLYQGQLNVALLLAQPDGPN
jgi:hypothetical protein